jgi:ADP-ribosyl-[dinitrogen reductase] hydrolase
MKTSVSHPLQIATIAPGVSGSGRVGVTFCPGKHDPHAMSGAWDRDLGVDLDAIRNWGAAAIVTLLEPKELTLLRVERLGEEVIRRNMLWFHLPIVDVSIPDQRFEEKWGAAARAVTHQAARSSEITTWEDRWHRMLERPRGRSACFCY